MEHSVIVVTVDMRRDWPARQPSPKKSPSQHRNHRLFACLEITVSLTLPFMDVEDRLSHVTLQENFLVFTIFRYPRAFTNLCQKSLGSKIAYAS
jgi:hypothetical protein